MDQPTECHCGSQNFYRIPVDRPGRAPYITDFVACAECRLMFHFPEPKPAASGDHEPGRAGIGGPPHARMSTGQIPRGVRRDTPK